MKVRKLALAALIAALPMSSAHALTVTPVADDVALTTALGGIGEPLMKFVGEGRIGNNADDGTFEYDIGTSTGAPAQTGQRGWSNGNNAVFSFDYVKSSGIATLSFGDNSDLVANQLKLDTPVYSVSFNAGANLGITDLYVRGRANSGTSILFEDLQVQIGGAIKDVVPIFSGNYYGTSAVDFVSPAIIRLSAESFADGFTLGGSVTFNWGDAQPQNSQLAFQIKAAETPAAPIPEPETYAILLAGFGLLGFSARRRKLT